MTTWIKDDKGNRNSVEYWGSKEAAKKALDSLVGCSDCSDCSDCSRCLRCSGCSGCLRCSRCSDLKNSSPIPGEQSGPPPIPVIENIHATIYAAASAPNALNMSAWHTCDNTHCRAGWTVSLAGEAGRELEKFYNTSLAAMLIYDASAPDFKINPGRFFDQNEDALADMKRLAEGAPS